MSVTASRHRLKTFGYAAALALAFGGLGSSAQAAHNASHDRPAAMIRATVTAQNTQAPSELEVDDGKNCGQSRKKMFVEGEGWIVRRVTTCY
jgi:hypothetical protein